MTQSSFVPQDPSTATVEYGFRAPAYFESAPWRHGLAWAWTGLTALLFLAAWGWGAATVGADFAQTLRSSYLTLLPAIMAVILFRQGGFDLSVGAVAGSSAAACAGLVGSVEAPLGVGILAGMAVALAFGLVNGALVAFLRVPGFLATVFTMMIGKGLVLSITGGRTLFLRELTEAQDVGASGPSTADLVGWGLAVALLVAALLLCQLRALRAPAAPRSWARQSLALGLPYLASSLVAGATGLLLMLYLRAATTQHGSGMEQDALLAVVVGGTWLAGRFANVSATALAALALAALQAVLMMHNVDPFAAMRLRAELALFLLVLGVLVHALAGGAYAGRKAAAEAAGATLTPPKA